MSANRHFGSEAAAALVLLLLYATVFLWMSVAFGTSRIHWKSRWGFLYFHVLVRLASQSCGLAFGILGFSNINLFIAYLILSAEGFFTLVLICARFLIVWHEHNRPSQTSFLEPRADAPETQRVTVFQYLTGQPLFWVFRPQKIQKQSLSFWHSILIVANACLIAGGSMLSGAIDTSELSKIQTGSSVTTGKDLRIFGQACFLAFSVFLGGTIVYTIVEQKRQGDFKGSRSAHPTLLLLLVAWVFLLARGIWGMLQASVNDLSYFNPSNYNMDGYTDRFTALENGLGVATEWIPVVLFNLTLFTSNQDPEKLPLGDAASFLQDDKSVQEADRNGTA